MNELQVFQNSEFGELGVLEIDNKPYFPATTCAKILGYVNPWKAINDHCKEDGLTKREVIDRMGRNQQVKFITEGNLYRLIVGSKLPAAEKFERWVFDEILPSIRRNGGYVGSMEKMAAQVATIAVAEVIRQLAPILPNYKAEQETPKYSRKRYPGIIERLPSEIRRDVDEMICSNAYGYREIVEYLASCGVTLSAMAVHRYRKSMGL